MSSLQVNYRDGKMKDAIAIMNELVKENNLTDLADFYSSSDNSLFERYYNTEESLYFHSS